MMRCADCVVRYLLGALATLAVRLGNALRPSGLRASLGLEHVGRDVGDCGLESRLSTQDTKMCASAVHLRGCLMLS